MADAMRDIALELARKICRELYDRFVMGGWEPQDAHEQVAALLRPHVSLPTFVIVADGEGAGIKFIYDAVPHQSVHDFMCFCERSWDRCLTTGLIDDIKLLDDPNEWFPDEDGRPFGISWHEETGSIKLYCVAALPSARLSLESSDQK